MTGGGRGGMLARPCTELALMDATDGTERLAGLAALFAGRENPRTGNATQHEPWEILVIALCTTLCGGENCTDMAAFGRAKEPFLHEWLLLQHGIPSHDSFSRVFRLLDPA